MDSTVSAVLALVAAATAASGYAVTKHLVGSYPPTRLIGVLFAVNSLLVVPAAPFVEWRWSWTIVGLHAASTACMVATSWAVFNLLPRGSAAAVATGQAVSPVAAIVFSALLLPGPVPASQIAVALAVVAALLATVSGSFEAIASTRAAATLLVAAAGNGLLAVLVKLLTEEGLGFVPIYVVRTAAAALVWLALAPPRGIPARALPTLTLRGAFVTASFACSILAIERGSPVTVQTFAATAPLMLVAASTLAQRRLPEGRILLASLVVAAGVFVTVWVG